MNLNNLPDKLKILDYMDFEINVPMHKCEHCKKIKDVELCINPYTQEINSEIHWEFICEDCYEELLADV